MSKDIVVTTPQKIARRGDLVGSVLRPALREGTVLYDQARPGRAPEPPARELAGKDGDGRILGWRLVKVSTRTAMAGSVQPATPEAHLPDQVTVALTQTDSLSRILAEVRAGETYLIVDRDIAIARIEPLSTSDSRMGALATDGSVVLPEVELDLARFLAMPKPAIESGASAAEALLQERAPGR